MSRWNNTHARYAIFALLPLQTAVMTQQEDFTLNLFESILTSDHPITKARRDSLIKALIWDESDYFTIDELRFFCTLRSLHGYSFRSEELIKQDRQILLNSVKYSNPQSSIEAGYLLKAMDFWELHYKDKKEEWGEKFREGVRRECDREARNARQELDEGYHSSDADEYEEWLQ